MIPPGSSLEPIIRAAGEKIISVLAPSGRPLENKDSTIAETPQERFPPSSPDSLVRKQELALRPKHTRKLSRQSPYIKPTALSEAAEVFEQGYRTSPIRPPQGVQEHLASEEHKVAIETPEKRRSRTEMVRDIGENDLKHMQKAMDDDQAEQSKPKRGSKITELGVQALEDLKDATSDDYFVLKQQQQRETERLEKNVEVAVAYAYGDKPPGDKGEEWTKIRHHNIHRSVTSSKSHGGYENVEQDKHLDNLLDNLQEWNLEKEKFMKRQQQKEKDTQKQEIGNENDYAGQNFVPHGPHSMLKHHKRGERGLMSILKHVESPSGHKFAPSLPNAKNRYQEKEHERRNKNYDHENDSTRHALVPIPPNAPSKGPYKKYPNRNQENEGLPNEESDLDTLLFATAMSRQPRTPAKPSLRKAIQNNTQVTREHHKHPRSKGPIEPIEKDVREYPVPGSFPQDVIPRGRQPTRLVSKPTEERNKDKGLATLDQQQAVRNHERRQPQKHDHKNIPATLKPIGIRELDENGMIPLMDGPVIVSRKLGRDGTVKAVPVETCKTGQSARKFESTERQVLPTSKAEDMKRMEQNLSSNNLKDDSQTLGGSPPPVEEAPRTAEGRLERVRQQLGPLKYYSSDSEHSEKSQL